jgi:hypothetical protein
MQKASSIRYQASGFVLLVLMLASGGFACAGEQNGNVGGEKGYVASGQASTDEAAAKGSEAAHDASVQASASADAIGDSGQYRHSCRIQTYIVKEGMSKAEVKDFNARITYRVQANLNGGGDKNLGELLDDIDVPAYRGFCG